MTAISESIEINRSPDDVFAYLDDVERHGEWQDQIVAVERQSEGPLQWAHASAKRAACPAGTGR
jgi:Polyketide cyclase / dehydrase and lipid transport.